ncbi:DUF2393 family protein [Granulicella tundricola]|uniref:DUF2393 domain-containing protein n=1 Tax=Granulicella tundricola (strain ATCC BAA-1859 / DSM 23138 / MP5ACTX9) TaxID=1198114 RepID=E8X3Y1_GRATM|nr:DUF2393 family protein [Granulicella tundricola]ADW70489.1 hypothetical protein AciX9_3484 [Granulicella tundricola MP5ACTX9]
MSDQTPTPALFTPPTPERTSSPILPIAIAGLVVVLILAGILLATHRKPALNPNAIHPLDPYAASLPITGIVMSESTSLSGGKSTFIDGHIRNTGNRTISSATVQVLFANDAQLPPQLETLPLAVIRTHEPYVDTQPLSDAPLKPGDDREFRLIFENINSNWNQQLPEIHVIAAK